MSSQNSKNKDGHFLHATCLGPITKLCGELSEFQQNLIYALNGVGKSYLARAFYILDQSKRDEDLDYTSEILLNDKSEQGSLSLIKRVIGEENDKVIGQLNFHKTAPLDPMSSDFIFHVFTSEYVENEVRKRHYNFDDIDLVGIPLGNSEINYRSTKVDLFELEESKTELKFALESRFESEKEELLEVYKISNLQVDEFEKLELIHFLDNYREFIDGSPTVANLRESLCKLEDLSGAIDFVDKSEITGNFQPEIIALLGRMTKVELQSENQSKSEILKEFISAREIVLQSIKTAFLKKFVANNIHDLNQYSNMVKQETRLYRWFRRRRVNRFDAQKRKEFAKTFKELLYFFFEDKYTYDTLNLTLKRGDFGMQYPHHAMSDGDRSVIDFCYYIASMHYKIKDDEDFQKLYLIIDDPVNSMSYDYIHAVCHVLRNLRYSKEFGLEIFGPRCNKTEYRRFKMLILTHSTYFFNLCRDHGIVKNNAAFWLFQFEKIHYIEALSIHVSPFLAHLLDIYNIVHNGKEYTHTTGNSMRCVLENIWRFRCPDIDNLTDFINSIQGVQGVEINKILLDADSHGYIEGQQIPKEKGKKACVDTLTIVDEFAPGQSAIIEKTINKVLNKKE